MWLSEWNFGRLNMLQFNWKYAIIRVVRLKIWLSEWNMLWFEWKCDCPSENLVVRVKYTVFWVKMWLSEWKFGCPNMLRFEWKYAIIRVKVWLSKWKFGCPSEICCCGSSKNVIVRVKMWLSEWKCAPVENHLWKFNDWWWGMGGLGHWWESRSPADSNTTVNSAPGNPAC